MAIKLNDYEQDMLNGKYGKATAKAMDIQVQMGELYGAERMLPITSVHMPGVSSTVTGEAACSFIEKMQQDGGKFKVLTTLNPCAIDLDYPEQFGFEKEGIDFQKRIIKAYMAMGGIPTCSCTPFFEGNYPRFGENVAWGESSAVVFCNSVMGARTNRCGGPAALAAAICGVVPAFGYYLDENRVGDIVVKLDYIPKNYQEYGAMGHAIGRRTKSGVPVILGLDPNISTDDLRSFSSAMATGGATALFHAVGITPEAPTLKDACGGKTVTNEIVVGKAEMLESMEMLTRYHGEPIDLVGLGCPFLSLQQIADIAERLKGKKVAKGVELWLMAGHSLIETARRMGYVEIIEQSGAKYMQDTCPDLGHMVDSMKNLGLRALATDSAKLAHYVPPLWNLPTVFKTTEECLEIALNGK